MRASIWMAALLAACGGGGGSSTTDGGGSGSGSGSNNGDGGGTVQSCNIFPSDHIFNTAIDSLPVDGSSSAYITTIGGSTKLHLDLGTEVDQSQDDYYGIPYNVVHGNSMSWPTAIYKAVDTDDYDWDPSTESDCADASHSIVSPCVGVPVILPIPASPLVESGINTSANQQPDDDHHMLIVDADTCRLWETYHSYSTSGTWNIFGSFTWDLTSDALRPADWTSADAAGFPIMPLLLKASEASSGTISHALRFTIGASKIRMAYVWPARHDTDTDSNAAHPPMGQLFRLKSSFQIPATDNAQAKAILQAMKTYGMYIADGGSDWYITGEPSADWQDDTFDQVQSVTGDNFEAVDITAITSRSGFDANSGKVPPP